MCVPSSRMVNGYKIYHDVHTKKNERVIMQSSPIPFITISDVYPFAIHGRFAAHDSLSHRECKSSDKVNAHQLIKIKE